MCNEKIPKRTDGLSVRIKANFPNFCDTFGGQIYPWEYLLNGEFVGYGNLMEFQEELVIVVHKWSTRSDKLGKFVDRLNIASLVEDGDEIGCSDRGWNRKKEELLFIEIKNKDGFLRRVEVNIGKK